nr:unnamed protein product [Callosobruchus analis]
MKHFSRDPDRSKQWQIDTRRDNWTAVTTIFSFSELKVSRKI